MIGAEIVNVTASFAVATLFISGRLEYWHLAAANLLLGLSWSVGVADARAMVPDLVGRELLMPAILLDSISMNVNKVLGPLVGGGMLATLGISGCYLLLGGVYAVGLLPLIALRLPSGVRTRSSSTLRYVLEGVQYCRQFSAVRGVLLITMAMNFFTFPYVQLLPVFARDVLHVGPLALGLLTAGDGIGSILGAFVLMNTKRLRRYGLAFVAGSLVASTSLVVFAASPVYVLALLALIVSGIGHSSFSTFQSTIVLQTVGEALRGRAMGLLTLAIGSAPLGMLFAGGVDSALSPLGGGYKWGSGRAVHFLRCGINPGPGGTQSRDKKTAPTPPSLGTSASGTRPAYSATSPTTKSSAPRNIRGALRLYVVPSLFPFLRS